MHSLTNGEGVGNVFVRASNPTKNGKTCAVIACFFVPDIISGVREYKTLRGNKRAVFLGCLKLPIPYSWYLTFIQNTKENYHDHNYISQYKYRCNPY